MPTFFNPADMGLRREEAIPPHDKEGSNMERPEGQPVVPRDPAIIRLHVSGTWRLLSTGTVLQCFTKTGQASKASRLQLELEVSPVKTAPAWQLQPQSG
jgi:hypothetical protein